MKQVSRLMVMLCVVGLVLSCAGFVLRTQTVKADSFLLWTKSGNAAPVATDVTISGSLEVAQELTGKYAYSDAESDPEGASQYQWQRADDAGGTNAAAIAGAAATTYTPQAADLGKFLRFEVIPVAQAGTSPGSAASSAWSGPVSDPCLVTTAADNRTTPPAGSLRQVLAKNPCCATITFASSVTAISLDAFSLRIPATCTNLTIDGGSGVTISNPPANRNRVLYVNSGANVRFRGLQIGGSEVHSFNGAGIYNDGGTVTIEASTTVRSNLAQDGSGGGIYNDGGTLTVNGVVSNNEAQFGGGIYNVNNGTVTIGSDGVVSGNTAATGGGIYNEGTLTVNGAVSGNTADTGGGIYNHSQGALTVDGAVSGNTAATGGGIYNEGTLTVNGAVSGNTAATGGGIYNEGTLTVNGEVSGNTADDTGGGIFNYGGVTGATSATVYDNTAATCNNFYDLAASPGDECQLP